MTKDRDLTVAIIQARLASRRLPQKTLMNINGKPTLERVIERVKASHVDKVVLATATNCDKLHAVAKGCKIEWCQYPDENDVLSRYFFAAGKYKASTIVRITADCPLVDPEIIDLAVAHFKQQEGDYVCNTGTYPDGLDVEVISYYALLQAYLKAPDDQREHVTTYIIRNPGKFMCSTLPAAKTRGFDPKRWHLSLDTDHDLMVLRKLFSKLGDTFSYQQLVQELLGNDEYRAKGTYK